MGPHGSAAGAADALDIGAVVARAVGVVVTAMDDPGTGQHDNAARRGPADADELGGRHEARLDKDPRPGHEPQLEVDDDEAAAGDPDDVGMKRRPADDAGALAPHDPGRAPHPARHPDPAGIVEPEPAAVVEGGPAKGLSRLPEPAVLDRKDPAAAAIGAPARADGGAPHPPMVFIPPPLAPGRQRPKKGLEVGRWWSGDDGGADAGAGEGDSGECCPTGDKE